MDKNIHNAENMIIGRNAVKEALSSGRDIDYLLVARGERKGSIVPIIAECKKRGILIKEADEKKLDYTCGGGTHQGVILFAAAHAYASVADILKNAEEKGEKPFIIVCDGIEDPHNLGAIIRSAEAAGAHGVIIPEHSSVSLTATVGKSAAGALEYVPVARVRNLTDTINELKKQGLWFYCADMDGEPFYKTDMTGAVGLVVGSEGRGVSRLVKQSCDVVVSMPMCGKINSLNASVAAGILMFEVVRNRMK